MTGLPEHAVRCPWCGAPPGTRCTTPRGRKLSIPSHDARHQAAAQATAQAAEAARDDYALAPPTTDTTDA